MSRSYYSRDPYWTTAKFNSTDANGNAVKRGDRIFYYPATKTVLTGPAADKASADFAGAAADEAMMNGQTW